MTTAVTARQLPSKRFRLLSVAIASIAIALAALAISHWRPDDASPAPGGGVNGSLAAVHDLDAATSSLNLSAEASYTSPSPVSADACAYYIAWGWDMPPEYGCIAGDADLSVGSR